MAGEHSGALRSYRARFPQGNNGEIKNRAKKEGFLDTNGAANEFLGFSIIVGWVKYNKLLADKFALSALKVMLCQFCAHNKKAAEAVSMATFKPKK